MTAEGLFRRFHLRVRTPSLQTTKQHLPSDFIKDNLQGSEDKHEEQLKGDVFETVHSKIVSPRLLPRSKRNDGERRCVRQRVGKR